jgi:plastocyanin
MVLALACMLNACSKDKDENTPVTPNTPTTTIDILTMSYSPSPKTVTKGTIITWRNTDTGPHTATANDGTFDTGTIAAGGSTTYTANTTGTFPYYCIIHGQMMTGTLIVNP